jgi:adenine-specific DNA-methyltransferase
MKSRPEELYRRIHKFINNSREGLLQLLVGATARRTYTRIIDCPTYPVPANTTELPEYIRNLQELLNIRTVDRPTLFAKLFAKTRTLEERKRSGQFFTSPEVAKWALSQPNLLPGDDVCDAGAGTAVFAQAIMQTRVAINSYVGIENDPILALCAAHVLELIGAPATYKVWYANFLTLDDSAFRKHHLNLPNVVVSNPPFVRSRYLFGLDRLRQELKAKLGFVPSSLSGSGSYFLSRAAALTTSNEWAGKGRKPRLLFFLPKEYGGAAHAHKLREDLRKMHRWNCQEYGIPHAQTGVDRHPSNALALFFVFEQRKAATHVSVRAADTTVRVSDILQIRRGISTGCNDFFVLNEEEARRRRLTEKLGLRRVLPTRIHLPDRVFTETYWHELRERGYPCWLLVLPDGKIKDFDRAVQEYLREGLRRGLHATPTAKTLRTWFSLPAKRPADVFITYFFRGTPRFILNEARVFNLTNILGGRFTSLVGNAAAQELIVNALNKQAIDWMHGKGAGREYKGGLRKIEPRELSNLPVGTSILRLLDLHKKAAAPKTGYLFD